MKHLKNKKALIISSVALGILVIAGTIAYNQDSIFFNNLFHVGNDVVEFAEDFQSPTNWQPCEEIPKTATATNKNATPRYVRMKINEYWRTANSATSADDHTTTDLPLTWTDNDGTHSYAIINTQNDDKWEQEGDWYYYTEPLDQNETTLSLLESVTLNCDANLVGAVTYSSNGLVGESTPTDYAGANYHVYVTFQMSEREFAPEQHHADCNSNILYDTIACQTNGLDTDVNFDANASVASGNGNGVNTLSAKANEMYPVYYFRGEVDNNNVIWHNICWKVIRTTTTGGVKIIYNGTPTGGQCLATGASAHITVNNSNTFKFNENRESPSDVGYKISGERDFYIPEALYAPSTSSDTFYFANNINYFNYLYNLDLTDSINGTYYNNRTASASKHHYFCPDGSTSCQNVGYIYGYDDSTIRYIKLRGGQDIETTKADHIYANHMDSSIKNTILRWYTDSSRQLYTVEDDELEDAVFCNDRSFYSGALSGKDSIIDVNDFVASKNRHGAYGRVSVAGNRHPSVDCPNKNDAFTKSDTVNGNAAGTFRAGLITADEVLLAGAGVYGDNSSYLYTGQISWTMSPYYFIEQDVAEYVFGASGLDMAQVTNAIAVRPVVSLKSGKTYVVGGTGTKTNPYVIE